MRKKKRRKAVKRTVSNCERLQKTKAIPSQWVVVQNLDKIEHISSLINRFPQLSPYLWATSVKSIISPTKDSVVK